MNVVTNAAANTATGWRRRAISASAPPPSSSTASTSSVARVGLVLRGHATCRTAAGRRGRRPARHPSRDGRPRCASPRSVGRARDVSSSRGRHSRVLPLEYVSCGRSAIVRRLRIRTGAPGVVIRTSMVAVSDCRRARSSFACAFVGLIRSVVWPAAGLAGAPIASVTRPARRPALEPRAQAHTHRRRRSSVSPTASPRRINDAIEIRRATTMPIGRPGGAGAGRRPRTGAGITGRSSRNGPEIS